MELIRGIHNLRARHRGCVVTTGAFDGVHRGHQAVLAHLKREGKRLGLPAVVIIFEPLPREYFQPLEAPPRILNFREKILALADQGIDRVLCLKFDPALQTMTAKAFTERIFVEGLGARYIVLGDDFRFGQSREGSLQYLLSQRDAYGFDAVPTDTVALEGERVSSTRIRGALEQGDFALAEDLLGRPFTMGGRVVYGKQLGQTLGSPTANIALNRLRSPLRGVFAVTVTGAGLRDAPGIANVGVRPTVDDSIRANLEVHVLDINRPLYGRRLSVRFLHKMRDEQKFESIEALRAHILADIDSARAWHLAHPTS
jgi:riboflavin kinase/FMN adenylyltransferase